MDDEESGERDAKAISKTERLPSGFGQRFRSRTDHYIPPKLPKLIPKLIKVNWRDIAWSPRTRSG